MSFGRFIAILLAVLVGSFGAAVGLNYWVDPYDLSVGPGRTEPPVRRETGSHGRLHKAYALMALKPSVVALGASRTEAAIRMDHPGWMGNVQDRYNASVTAANLREIWAFLQLAAKSGRLKQVLIGLEFYSFNVFVPNRPDYEPELMDGDPPHILGIDSVKARYYLSFDGFVSTLRTLSDKSDVPHFLLDGMVNPVALKESYQGHDGQEAAFLAVEKESLLLFYTPPPRHQFSLEDAKAGSSLVLFRQILDFARARNIDLRFYISPGHARNGEIMEMLGLEDQYDAWQRALVGILEEEGAASGAKPFPLWDFGSPTSITTEPVPPDDPNGPRSRWFWESSHYRVDVGDLVLDRIFGYRDPARTVPEGFGVQLNSSNLAAHQAAARQAQLKYRQDHAQELNALHELGGESSP